MPTKEDHAAYMREYYKTRPEQLEQKKQRDREYYLANRERKIEQGKQYYLDNQERIKERISIADKAKRLRLRKEAIELKGGRCMDCDNMDERVFQFHHRPDEIKIDEVMSLAKSAKKFWEEVEKCDLVCANHHMIRHAEGK